MKKYFLYSLLTLLSSAVFSQTKSEASLSVSQIFQKSEESYAALKTYLDSGKVISEFYNNEVPGKSSIKFRTAYSELLGFNFEYYDPNKSNSLYTINKSGNVVKSWWGIRNKIETPASLSMAIATATGVSSSTSNMVPRLLLPAELGQRNIYMNVKGAVSRTEAIDGHICYVIEGNKSEGEIIKLWISKSDFLIRKIFMDKKIDVKASQAKRDSLITSQAKSLKIKLNAEKDSVKRAGLIKQVKTLEDLNAQLLKRQKELPQVASVLYVKTTYYYYPYFPEILNKDLFTFRPNREIAL